MFAAAAMRAVASGDELDGEHEGRGAQRKEELEAEAREEGKPGNKAWLRRRLHAAIVREHLEASRKYDRRGVTLLPSSERPTPDLRSRTFTVLNHFCAYPRYALLAI